jgi:DNA polymerase V
MQVFSPDFSSKLRFPLLLCPISAGVPGAVEGHVEDNIDLNHYLSKHPEDTYVLKVVGNSMIEAGIHHGDIVIVDRTIRPSSGDIVVAFVDGEHTLKRLDMDLETLLLVPENEDYQPLTIHNEADFQVWAVVTDVIHKLYKR